MRTFSYVEMDSLEVKETSKGEESWNVPLEISNELKRKE